MTVARTRDMNANDRRDESRRTFGRGEAEGGKGAKGDSGGQLLDLFREAWLRALVFVFTADDACLMVLLVHLRVLSVGRLRITAAVTIGTVVYIAVGGGILRHALRKTWTLRAVLRSCRVARGGRLVPDGR
jgi:hypothetical protein